METCDYCGATCGSECENPNRRGCPYFGAGPIPDCYGCLGTGKIQGFGHHGKKCPCLYAEDE